MVDIAASVLGLDNIEAALDPLLDYLDIIHLDVMDGRYVKKKTLDYDDQSAYTVERIAEFVPPGVYLDTHLMIDLNSESRSKIKKFIDAGSCGVTIHYESFSDNNKSDISALLEYIRSAGVDAGIAVEPDTPVELLLPYLDLADRVLVMTVKSGEGGQGMIESALEKIPYLRSKGYDGIIQVDGGVNLNNIEKVKRAGADEIVIGSGLRKNNMPSLKIFNKFKDIVGYDDMPSLGIAGMLQKYFRNIYK